MYSSIELRKSQRSFSTMNIMSMRILVLFLFLSPFSRRKVRRAAAPLPFPRISSY